MKKTRLHNKNGKVKNKKLRIFLIRHGEPRIYGESNSGLSSEGKEQIIKAAEAIFKSFKNGEAQRIKILYSSRKRTVESSIVLVGELKRLIKNKNIENIKVHSPVRSKLMGTADSLDNLIKHGYPLATAYGIWINLPVVELKLLNIQSPEEIRKSFIGYLIKQYEKNRISDLTTNINIIGITHETTLLAFQMKLFPEFKQKPDYAEFMEIYFDRYTKPIFKFRGKEAEY